MSTASKFGIRGLVLAGLVFGAGSVRAVLTEQVNDTVYDSVQDLTWDQDGNAVKTLCDANDPIWTSFVPPDAVSGGSGRGLADICFADGRLNWYEAEAWVAHLNAQNYKGITNWRQHHITDTNDLGCNYANSRTDCGYNVDLATGELAHLWYWDLANIPYCDTSGFCGQTGWGFNNSLPFTNTRSGISGIYWSGTEYAPNPPAYVWCFFAGEGWQYYDNKTAQNYVWPVRPGQVQLAIDCFATVDYLGNTNDRIRLTHPSDSPTMGPTTSVPHEIIVSVLAPDGTVRGNPITLEFAERETEVRTMKQIFDAAGLNIYDSLARGNIIQLSVPTGFLVSGTVQQGSQIVPLIFRCHLTPPPLPPGS